MARNDNAVLKVGTGEFYTADVGTPLPANILEPGETYTSMGHTSLEDILNSASEGGESTTLSSLQKRDLRTSISARTESYNINLLQFDSDSLTLYYGANAEVTEDGHVRPAQSPIPTEAAWLFVFRDGDRVGGIYAPRASIFRGDDVAITDTEALQSLNLQITPLAYEGNEYTIEFIPPKPIVVGDGSGN